MVQVYEVSKDASKEFRQQIANLFMGQMGTLGYENPDESTIHAIELALQEHSQAHIFVAEKEGELVGAAFLNVSISIDIGGYYIWLNDLYVRKDQRNQGIAKKMLLHIIHWAEQRGIKGIELETGVNNEATKALYNSLGFYDIVSKRYGARI